MIRILCVLVVHAALVTKTSGADYVAKLNEFRRLHQVDDVQKNDYIENVTQASVSL